MAEELRCNLPELMAKERMRTFTELIKRTGINRNTLTKIYAGKNLHRVQLTTYIRLCDGLNCSLHELLSYK